MRCFSFEVTLPGLTLLPQMDYPHVVGLLGYSLSGRHLFLVEQLMVGGLVDGCQAHVVHVRSIGGEDYEDGGAHVCRQGMHKQ